MIWWIYVRIIKSFIRVIRLLYYLPMERMEKWDLLYMGNVYVEVHTFKWKNYVTIRDFSTTTNALSKKALELEEENKKLKEDVDYRHHRAMVAERGWEDED